MRSATTALLLGLVVGGTAAQPVTEVTLASRIAPSAVADEPVAFLDRTGCRYTGRLGHVDATNGGIAATYTQAAGVDAQSWYIVVTHQACDRPAIALLTMIALPKAPSLAGGGGIPPSPRGYEPGTRLRVTPQ